MLNNEIIETNYKVIVKYLNAILGEETTEKLIGAVGGEEQFKNATFSNTDSSGSAYNGALIENMLKIGDIAKKLNKEFFSEDDKSLYKVAILQHLSKAIMYEKNDNTWEVTNRGILYKFTELPAAIRCGERSALIAMSVGVQFTPEEFEAMLIIDKQNANEDNYTKFFSTNFSNIIKMANEICRLKNLENNKNEKQ